MVLNQLLRQNEVVAYFLYGLAYFSMGTTLLAVLRRPSGLPLIRALPWLAGFGIVHGVYAWIEMLMLVPGYAQLSTTRLFFAVLHLAPLGISAGLLFQFGVTLIRNLMVDGRFLRYLPLSFFGAWLLTSVVFGATGGPQGLSINGDVAARYLLYLPGSIASGVAFYLQYRLLNGRKYGRFALYSLAVAGFFLLNAFFAGVIVPKALFWPASALNVDRFYKAFGLSSIDFRALCAVGVSTFVFLGTRVFDAEESAARKRRENELEEERRIARVLQESLLSPTPYIEGVEVKVYYKPATARMIVGGDFYDFIELPDGRLAMVIGDVSGKGLNAAVLTSTAKNTIRAFMYEDPSPASVLKRANQVLTNVVLPGEFVTVLVVVLGFDYEFDYASAGHPPILLSGADCRYLEDAQGMPLGIFASSKYIERTGKLSSYGFMLLYTDGLIDARRGADFFGDEGLRDSVRRLRALDASGIANGVARTALEFASGNLHDDMALVVLRRTRDRLGKFAA
ncbi:MAG: serine/threonine-protein phosphatase [Actinobacteria bacterium]|nr:serine/threonine-protein phosphatase [Actinomycetota bacterium]